MEKLEKEVSDEDVLSEEQPTQETEDEDDKSQGVYTIVWHNIVATKKNNSNINGKKPKFFCQM